MSWWTMAWQTKIVIPNVNACFFFFLVMRKFHSTAKLRRNREFRDCPVTIQPQFMEKPPSQSPCSFRIIPPQPARPGLPKAEPSVLSRTQPCWAFSHLTCTIYQLPDNLGLMTQWKNSAAWNKASLCTLFCLGRSLNTKLFLCFHKCQITKGKIILHGGWFCTLGTLSFQFFSSQ